MSDDFLWALQDTWGLSETAEEDATVAASQLADAVTAWLTGDPGHELERNLERVQQNLEFVGDCREGQLLATAVTLVREAYDSGCVSESWRLAGMVREVADSLSLAA